MTSQKQDNSLFQKKEYIPYCLALIVLVMGILFMPYEQYVGDPLVVHASAWSLIENGRMDVPEKIALSAGQPGQNFVKNTRTGLYYSKYGMLHTWENIPVLLVEKSLNGSIKAFSTLPGRVMLLNIKNIIFSVILAVLLYYFALLFTKRCYFAFIWALLNLYAVFAWNYLRAQTAELTQWMLVTAFIFALVALLRAFKLKTLIICQILFFLLVFCKNVFVLFGPFLLVCSFFSIKNAYLAGLNLDKENCHFKNVFAENKKVFAYLLLPLFVTAFLFLLSNYVRFGGWFSTGYDQWAREGSYWSGSLINGLMGFMFDPQKSIFIYQPLLTLSLLAFGSFYRSFKRESVLIFSIFTVFLLVNSQYVGWHGHWSYGPRHLLVVLTPMTLPILCVMEYFKQNFAQLKVKIATCITALILAFSFFAQMEVNSLPFFTTYYVQAVMDGYHADKASQKVQKTPFFVINYQLKALKNKNAAPGFMHTASREVSSGELLEMSNLLRSKTVSNYWFFR